MVASRHILLLCRGCCVVVLLHHGCSWLFVVVVGCGWLSQSWSGVIGHHGWLLLGRGDVAMAVVVCLVVVGC